MRNKNQIGKDVTVMFNKMKKKIKGAKIKRKEGMTVGRKEGWKE